jgi:hypothetical protein
MLFGDEVPEKDARARFSARWGSAPSLTLGYRPKFPTKGYARMGFHPLRLSDNSSLCFIIITNASFVK